MLGSMAALLAQSQVDKMMARIVGERPRITGYSLTGTFKGTRFDSWKKIDSHASDVCVFCCIWLGFGASTGMRDTGAGGCAG